MEKTLKGVTLIELIVVIVIIGILATLGLSQMFAPREQAITNEAQINLKLIASAEKIYRLETTFYVSSNNTLETNQRLKLSLPVSKPNWNYKVSPAATSTFVGKAGRVKDNNSTAWCINQTTEEPYNTSCPY
jgi:prepilin-type N-terminal cleavage/methylation domain-containing protein